MTAVVLRGDARSLPLPDGSVDLIVTSPPYFGLRSYVDTCRICLDVRLNGLDPAATIVGYDEHVRRAHHYDGQIGSEATPGEWLAALVECTREWVRVLKPSGSLFVNLGDSYASQPAGRPGTNAQVSGRNPAEAHAARRGERQRRPNGGRQFTREDAAWLAGVIDSDGSISVRINRQPEGNAPSFVPWVRVGQMRPEVVTRIAELVGTGKVMQDTRGVWSWTAAAQQARWVLERIHPWLLIKKRQAWAAIEVARHVEDRNAKGAWRQLTADDIAYRQRLRDAVLAWNKGRPDDTPVPEPRPVALPVYPFASKAKSLHGLPWQYALECVGRLGLILRRDIVWHKTNGLPESCNDRCRSSHEYVFHLVKQPRYYAAVDEIREPHTGHTGNDPGKPSVSGNGLTHRSFGRNMSLFNPLGKLPGSVWDIPSQPLTVPAALGIDHFAAYPMELPRRIILGWSPPGICTACGEGRRPIGSRELTANRKGTQTQRGISAIDGGAAGQTLGWERVVHITGYACACTPYTDHPGTGERYFTENPGGGSRGPNTSGVRIPHVARGDDGAVPKVGPWREYHLEDWAPPPTRPALVVDPFGGTGTTALVAATYGRTGISFDLSADYCRLARWRTTDPAERAKALQVPKPPPVPEGQASLFDEVS